MTVLFDADYWNFWYVKKRILIRTTCIYVIRCITTKFFFWSMNSKGTKQLFRYGNNEFENLQDTKCCLHYTYEIHSTHQKSMKNWSYISTNDEFKIYVINAPVALWVRRCRLYISARQCKYLKSHYWNLLYIQTRVFMWSDTHTYTQIGLKYEMQYEIDAEYSKHTHTSEENEFSENSCNKRKSVRGKNWRWSGKNVSIRLN